MSDIYDDDLKKHGPYVKNLGAFIEEQHKKAFESHEWDDGVYSGNVPAKSTCKICGSELHLIQKDERGINTYYSFAKRFYHKYGLMFKAKMDKPDYAFYTCGEVCARDIIT